MLHKLAIIKLYTLGGYTQKYILSSAHSFIKRNRGCLHEMLKAKFDFLDSCVLHGLVKNLPFLQAANVLFLFKMDNVPLLDFILFLLEVL